MIADAVAGPTPGKVWRSGSVEIDRTAELCPTGYRDRWNRCRIDLPGGRHVDPLSIGDRGREVQTIEIAIGRDPARCLNRVVHAARRKQLMDARPFDRASHMNHDDRCRRRLGDCDAEER